MTASHPAVEVAGLTRSYGDHTVLESVAGEHRHSRDVQVRNRAMIPVVMSIAVPSATLATDMTGMPGAMYTR